MNIFHFIPNLFALDIALWIMAMINLRTIASSLVSRQFAKFAQILVLFIQIEFWSTSKFFNAMTYKFERECHQMHKAAIQQTALEPIEPNWVHGATPELDGESRLFSAKGIFNWKVYF